MIRVIDSGDGIAADHLERVFDMFARAERAGSEAEHGLGIGLALARRLAELHGGTLTAASDGPGRGTTFTLRLPALDAVADAPHAADQAQAAGGGATPLHIVIIEDNPDGADTLAAWLAAMGHRVEIANSGPRGLELVEKTRPNLVLCDLGLPDMDGIEVCRRVRQLSLAAQPLMVALTGWGRDGDRQRTAEAGFDEHLVKPVAVELLRQVLTRAAS